MEPDYLAQNGEALTKEERLSWVRARADDAHAAGCELVRASSHPDIANLVLVEGWKDRRAKMGEPRWQLTTVTAQ